MNLGSQDGKLVNSDTGEEIQTETELNDLMPDWLMTQHNAGPPQVVDE